MKKLLDYLPLHFATLLILGIVAQFYTHFWQLGFLKLILLLILISFSLIIISNRKIILLLSTLLFFFMGVSSVYFNNQTNHKSYYKKKLTDSSSVIFTIKKVLKPTRYYNRYKARVGQVDATKTTGTILLNIKKDSIEEKLQVDEKIYGKPTFKDIVPPLNPHQFDYRSYLKRQDIEQQIFTEVSHYKKIDYTSLSLQGVAAKIRRKIQKSLKNYSFKKDELAVINALLLGQRNDLSKELILDYSRAGVIHILAISGLHIGIILFILLTIFKPLKKYKYGRVSVTILIIVILWMFALIAGLSPSVVRAVTMFTFVAIGSSFRRKTNVTFSLVSSMFFLLLLKPLFLFDVGFQLSYLAVFGIVWIQPKLYTIYTPKYRIDGFFWSLFTVSIAAQIGILPLSLYYFHQFPGLFMLPNLIIIPLLGAILSAGIIIVILSALGGLPEALAEAYGFVILSMNRFVHWVSMQEQFLIKEISISFLLMLSFYVALIFGMLFLIKKTTARLMYFLSMIILLQTVLIIEKYQRNHKEEFIVFHQNRQSVLGKRMGKKWIVYITEDSLKKNYNSLMSYKIGENLIQTTQTKYGNIFDSFTAKILRIDSLGAYRLNTISSPIVLLQYTPKINLKRLIKTLKPIQIIADGTNYKSDVFRWRRTSNQHKIPFHYTGQNGAFIIRK